MKTETAIRKLKSHEAKWTDDCSGKKDFDGELLSLSTRYWPRGGGYFIMRSPGAEFEGNETRPEIKPSAKASILLRGDSNITLASQEFEAETEDEVKALVEAWAQKEWKRLVGVLMDAYPEAKTFNG